MVVTFNYRLGVFGFLSAGLQEVSGNAGLLDQALALAWVRQNIANFAGDPRRITVIGEGAGGRSASLHVISAASRGSFTQAGSFSGVDARRRLPDMTVPSREVGRNLGCGHDLGEDMIRCLRQQSPEDLLREGQSLTWDVTVDGDFLTDVPHALWNSSELEAGGKKNAVLMYAVIYLPK